MAQKDILKGLALLLLSGGVGWLLSHAPVPLPYMLGAMASTAAAVAILPRRTIARVKIPEALRLPFIACIGLLIGAQVHMEEITNWRVVIALALAVTFFTPMAHFVNYQLMRRFGGYDRPTAFFSAAPGGLIEAMTLGEKAGAHVPLLTVQQFLRIILVVTILPFALSLWVGHPVGSAAGMEHLSAEQNSPLWRIILVGAVGFALGHLIKLPAAQMLGPMILAGALTTTGLLPLVMPDWLIIVSQIVIGAALGLRFNGLSATVLRRGAVLALGSAAIMISLGAVLSVIIVMATGIDAKVALLSLAPGGVTEMALVALSIAADPALVAIAHAYRISLTVLFMAAAFARFNRSPSLPE